MFHIHYLNPCVHSIVWFEVCTMIEKEKRAWDVIVYSDSDWAGDRDTRKSITGYIVFVLGCPVVWKSRQQPVISLSLSEAEYYALSEAAKEIAFVYQLMSTMGIETELPIVARVDNMGVFSWRKTSQQVAEPSMSI